MEDRRSVLNLSDEAKRARLRRFIEGGHRKLFPIVSATIALMIVITCGLAYGLTARGGPSGAAHESLTSATASSVPFTTPTTSAPLTGPSSAGAPDVPTPGGASAGIGGFDAVACPTTSFCVAVGANGSGSGVAATSGDGGTTWTSQTVPSQAPELDAVACANTDDCVAVGSEAELTTMDGGVSWSSQALPVPNTTLLGVTCTSTLLCIAVGVARDSIGPYAPVVLTSSDGGSSWSTGSLPAGSLGVGSVACPTSTDCIAVGATVLTSEDSGATWQTGTVNGGSGPLRSISCSSSEVCVAVGPNAAGLSDPSAAATAIVTTDGGATWNPENFPSGTSGVNQMSCASSTQCSAVGSSLSASSSGTVQLADSADGGQTWSLASPLAGLTSVASISCPAVGECVVVGQSASGAEASSLQNGTWATESVTQKVGALS